MKERRKVWRRSSSEGKVRWVGVPSDAAVVGTHTLPRP